MSSPPRHVPPSAPASTGRRRAFGLPFVGSRHTAQATTPGHAGVGKRSASGHRPAGSSGGSAGSLSGAHASLSASLGPRLVTAISGPLDARPFSSLEVKPPHRGDAYASGSTQPGSAPRAPAASPAHIGPEEQVIGAVMTKLLGRLPHRSHQRVPSLDADDVARQACLTLLAFCSRRPAVVVAALMDELERLLRPSGGEHDRARPTPVQQRSTMLLLRVIALSLQTHWAHVRARRAEKMPDGAEADEWTDPPPLDEALAKRLAAVATTMMKRHDDVSPVIAINASAAILGSVRSGYQLARDTTLPEPGSRTRLFDDCATPAGHGDIVKRSLDAVALIVHYVSASNWEDAVLPRIRSRLSYWSSAPDEALDLSEARWLDYSSINRERLGCLIRGALTRDDVPSLTTAELNNRLISVKKAAQVAICASMRTAIWTWIQSCPADFENLVATNRRVEGAPEILFDLCWAIGDSSKRKGFSWPLASMLCVRRAVKLY